MDVMTCELAHDTRSLQRFRISLPLTSFHPKKPRPYIRELKLRVERQAINHVLPLRHQKHKGLVAFKIYNTKNLKENM